MMKTIISAAIAGLFAAVSAAPVYNDLPPVVDITFLGAGGASFDQEFPTDGSRIDITNTLSISQIAGHVNGVTCTFHGIDGSETSVPGAATVPVGPPQTQVYGFCSPWSSIQKNVISSPWMASQLEANIPSVVDITFLGAAGAHFDQLFPTDGSVHRITNPLSISQIVGHVDGVTCTFHGIDGSTTTISGVTTVSVGPPQTQIYGSCRPSSSIQKNVISSPWMASRLEADIPSVVDITFLGAAGAYFDQPFPTDGSVRPITNPLSISQIAGHVNGVICMFRGIDGGQTIVPGARIIPVGPPQTQIYGSCRISQPSNSKTSKGCRITVE